MTTLTAGQAAPPFSLGGIDGKPYTLNQNGARLTLAVFFKTDCPTSMTAWPYVEKLHRSYHGAGLTVWGLSQDSRERSAEFAAKFGSTFPILVDADWRISRLYDPQFVPTLFLIDSTGQILETVVAFDKARLNHLSQTVAGHLKVPAAIVAPPEDGVPPFKPG